MNKFLAILVLLIAAGCSETARLPDDAYQAEADAVVALAFSAEPVLVSPDGGGPSPDDDWKKPGAECRNCYGTGRSGDGQSMCRVCGGDGRIDERDIQGAPPTIGKSEPRLSQPAASKRTIVMHVTAETASGWPQKWWRETRPQLVADGWEVTVERDGGLIEEAYFEVCEGDVCRKLTGEQPYEAF